MGRAIDVQRLSRDERLDSIEQLWESLSEDERNSLPLTADQERELDRRLDGLEKEGPVGLSPTSFVSVFVAVREGTGLPAEGRSGCPCSFRMV